MDDSPIPYGSGQEPAEEVLPASPDRRRGVLGLAAVAVVALAVGGVLLIGSGSDEDLAATAAAAPAAAPVGAAPSSPAPTPAVDEAAPTTPGGRESRNPFAALVLSTGGSDVAAGEAGSSPDGASAPDGGQAPAAMMPADASGSSPAAAAGGAGSSAPAAGSPVEAVQRLALVRVTGEGDARTAVFSLDGQEQTAAVGAGFGPAGELLLLSVQQGPEDGQWTAVVQRGAGDPFDVVTGTPVTLG